MSNPKAMFVMGCAGWLVACSSGGSAASADIAKIVDVKSSFGSEFQVKDTGPASIDPKFLASQKLPPGLKFDPPDCAKFAIGQDMPPGLQGNMAAVSAEGDGNRFIVIALETSEPVPVTDRGQHCRQVGFAGGKVRGVVEEIDAPRIDGVRTQGIHTVRQASIGGKTRSGELYKYSAHFGSYQVIVIANPLVVPDKPVVPVDIGRARGLLESAVAAVRS